MGRPREARPAPLDSKDKRIAKNPGRELPERSTHLIENYFMKKKNLFYGSSFSGQVPSEATKN